MKNFFINVVGVPENKILLSLEPTWKTINRDKDTIQERYWQAGQLKKKLLVFVYMSCHGRMTDKLWLVLNEEDFYIQNFSIEHWLSLWSRAFKDDTYTVGIADSCRDPWRQPEDYARK